MKEACDSTTDRAARKVEIINYSHTHHPISRRCHIWKAIDKLQWINYTKNFTTKTDNAILFSDENIN